MPFVVSCRLGGSGAENANNAENAENAENGENAKDYCANFLLTVS